MQPNEKSREHLRRASEHALALARSDNVIEIEKHWKEFLHSIERCWNKALAHYSRSPKWSGWQGKYLKAREQDPLLAYARRARDADEHNIEEITEKTLGETSIVAIDPAQPVMFSGRIGPEGVTPHFEHPNSNWTMHATPASIQLLPVVNRGKLYPVPTSHLGKPLTNGHPAALALLIIAYYEAFLTEADAFFVK